jgi:hypothetical protein
MATVYLTSGDANLGAAYVAERERGILAAYSLMASLPNDWTCGAFTLASKSIERCVHDQRADLQLYYLRLEDGFSKGGEPESLLKLWTGQVSKANAVVGGGSFTRGEMLAVLDALLRELAVTNIYTTDFLFGNTLEGDDHSDHEITALFALAASAAYDSEHSLNTYRTYNTRSETSNVNASDAAMVKSVFEKYAACDSAVPGCSSTADCETNSCSTVGEPYTLWYSKNYSETRLSAFDAQAVKSGTKCLTANTMGVSASICDASASQSWSYNKDSTLALADGSGCLTTSGVASSGTLSLTICSGTENQRFALMSGGKIIIAAPPNGDSDSNYTQSYCLVDPSSWNGALSIAFCATNPNQLWTLP